MAESKVVPDFFIVGAPKCGTTALNEYLRRHPEIYIPVAKELHFFGSDLKFRTKDITLERYLSNFSSWNGEKRVGETSVWYLYSKNAAEEIKQFSPSANIVMILRNPVEMLYSLYHQLLYNGDEDLPTFEAALDAEEDRKNGRRIPTNAHVVHSLFYTDIGKYTNQVRRYFDTFGVDRVHVITFDDLIKDTSRAYRETLEFLGVDPNFRTDFNVVNPNKRVRSEFVRRWIRDRPQWFRSVINKYIPQSLKYRILYKIISLNTVRYPRPDMSEDTSRRLRKQFAQEIEQLSSLLGRDLTHWTKE